MRLVHPSLLAIGLLVVALPALAQQRVYQWKDASGVTHYTDTPPAQAHQTRDISTHSGTASEVATVKPEENKQCQDARSNLKRLQSDEALGVDTDGDGKADRSFSADERAAQTELSQAAVKAYCPPAG